MREASETIARQVRNAVRETVSARRIQGAAGRGWPETAIDQILFRGSHGIMRALDSYPSPVVHALMASVVRFMLHEFLAIDATEAAVAGGEGCLPTAENVNALPEGIRRYVHDLETRGDPAHDVQKMALQADTIRRLDARVRELEAELASERRKGERGNDEESRVTGYRALAPRARHIGLRRVRVGVVGQSAPAPAGWHILPPAIGLDTVGR